MNDHALQNLRRFDSLMCVCGYVCFVTQVVRTST